MNITILVNKDIASCLALNYLMAGLSEHRLSVFYSSRVGSKPLPPPLQQLKFYEQDFFNEFVYPVQAKLPASGNQELLGFECIRDKLQGRCVRLNAINDAEQLALFSATEPALVLSIRYGVILKDAAIAVPPLGILNLHSGRLPDYKGVMASFWAMLNGEEELGTTLHYISDSGIDTGEIISRTTLQVRREKTYMWHVLALYEAGCQAMLSAVNSLIAEKKLEKSPQEGEGAYYSFPQEKHLEQFQARNLRLFDPVDALNLAKRFCSVD